MILVDTGPLVAAANCRDKHHSASVQALAAARPPRLVPDVVIAEVSYLLGRDAGAAVEAAFLRSPSEPLLKPGFARAPRCPIVASLTRKARGSRAAGSKTVRPRLKSRPLAADPHGSGPVGPRAGAGGR